MIGSGRERLLVGVMTAAAVWLALDVHRLGRPVDAGASAPSSVEPAMPDQPWARLDQGRFDLVVERSLFTPDRRADFDSVGGRDSAVAGFVLRGLVLAPSAKLALFEPAGGGRSVALRQGEQLAGRLVLTIGSDGVTIDDNGTERRLAVAADAPVVDRADDSAPRATSAPSGPAAIDPIGDASGDPGS